jgi:ribosomal protein L11 methylase PrmA
VTECHADPASYRDPAGQVFIQDRRIFRTVAASAVEQYEFVRDSGLLSRLALAGRLVETVEVDSREIAGARADVRYLLEHTPIPYLSYPYEWSFAALQCAALHHLGLQLDLLEQGAALSDASAYNVQFNGSRPVFIDLLSLRRYREGEYWLGHRQFCEQFLNPLLLRALLGVPHNAWYRGSLEGIPTAELAPLVPLRRRLSFSVLTHVILQARLHNAALRRPEQSIARVSGRQLPAPALAHMLRQLRRWIARLRPADRQPTAWARYGATHSYEAPEELAKRRFVAEFVTATRPRLLFDLGCNTGDYAMLALEAGAGMVVGWDNDQDALDAAFVRATDERLAFLPLFLDAANPSPDQGWRQTERQGFDHRASADALLALAFAHHLAIGRNIPLDQLVSWLVGLAPRGVIEFVPKADPTVQRMLALREDIFRDYEEAGFRSLLAGAARIVRSEAISSTGRTLYWYERQ